MTCDFLQTNSFDIDLKFWIKNTDYNASKYVGKLHGEGYSSLKLYNCKMTKTFAKWKTTGIIFIDNYFTTQS